MTDETTISNAYREAVEDNKELSAPMDLLYSRLTELIKAKNENNNSILRLYVRMLQYLCKDFICKHGKGVARRCGIEYFWTKVIDFNGTQDLSDGEMTRLTDLGRMLQYKRYDVEDAEDKEYVEDAGHANDAEDAVISWINDVNSKYKCQSDAIASARFETFKEKWKDEVQKSKAFADVCEDVIREIQEDTLAEEVDWGREGLSNYTSYGMDSTTYGDSVVDMNNRMGRLDLTGGANYMDGCIPMYDDYVIERPVRIVFIVKEEPMMMEEPIVKEEAVMMDGLDATNEDIESDTMDDDSLTNDEGEDNEGVMKVESEDEYEYDSDGSPRTMEICTGSNIAE